MNLWDKISWPASAVPCLDDRFTTEEVEQLTNLRERIASLPVHLDLQVEARRLEFARWLVEHGRMDEGFALGMPPLRRDGERGRRGSHTGTPTTEGTPKQEGGAKRNIVRQQHLGHNITWHEPSQ
jgi:hypothetical protein